MPSVAMCVGIAHYFQVWNIMNAWDFCQLCPFVYTLRFHLNYSNWIKPEKHKSAYTGVAVQSILQHHSYISCTSIWYILPPDSQSPSRSLSEARDSLHFEMRWFTTCTLCKMEGIPFSIQLSSCTLLYFLSLTYTKIEHKFAHRLTDILRGTWPYTQTQIYTPGLTDTLQKQQKIDINWMDDMYAHTYKHSAVCQ